MTRFGVRRRSSPRPRRPSLGVVARRSSGRERLDFLNPVPIRLISDQWIDKYTERQVSALANLKAELEDTA